MEQISNVEEGSLSLTYEHCQFSKIARKVFTKFRNVKSVEFYNSNFEEIQEGAFDFKASDISLKIEGATKPFKLNQDIFVDFKVSNLVLKDVEIEEFTKEALQGMVLLVLMITDRGAELGAQGEQLRNHFFEFALRQAFSRKKILKIR